MSFKIASSLCISSHAQETSTVRWAGGLWEECRERVATVEEWYKSRRQRRQDEKGLCLLFLAHLVVSSRDDATLKTERDSSGDEAAINV